MRAEMRQDLQHVMRVAQIRHVMEDALLSGQQRRGQDRQSRILRAADLDRAGERMAAVNEDLIHTWQRGIVSHLHNRFALKCRCNFFGQKGRERLGLADPDLQREQPARTQTSGRAPRSS